MENLILENLDTGQQVTTWFYGTTLATSDIARNDTQVGKQYPTGEASSSSFNRQGESKSSTQPNGTIHEYGRDNLGRLLSDSATTLGPDIDDSVLRISTEYNNRGQVETITSWDSSGAGNVVNQIGYEYDAFNQMVADKQAHGGTVDGSTPEVTYSFTDGSNNLLRLTNAATPSGNQTDFSYGASSSIDDSFNRPASLQVSGETDNLVEYEYAGTAMVTNVKYPTPDVGLSFTSDSTTGDAGDSLTGYDRFGRVIDMPWLKLSNSSVLAQIQYGYDSASRRLWRQDLTPQADRKHDRFYGYDDLSQIKNAAVGTLNINRTSIGGVPTQDEAWNYDETGNWLGYQKDEDGANTVDETRQNNVSNQITSIDGSSNGIAHDLNGNITQMPTGEGLQGPSWSLKWDAWNRLVEVRNTSDNAAIGKYTYDGTIRRTTKTVSDGTITHFYYNDQWRSVEERENISSTPSAIYYWGARSRWDLARKDRYADGDGTLGETLFCLNDAMDPIAVIDPSGSVQERYEYSAFGVTSFLEVDYSIKAVSGFDWRFLFHGEFIDSESDFYNYGFRFYDPQNGRWASRDQIAEQGGVNLYAFVENSTLVHVDYLGLNRSDYSGSAIQNISPETHLAEQIIVEESNSGQALEYLGFWVGMEALRIATIVDEESFAKTGQSEHREFGGMICRRCCGTIGGNDIYEYTYTGPTRGGISVYSHMSNASTYDGFTTYLDFCPQGWEAVGRYHSHPGNPSNNASKSDWFRMRNPKRTDASIERLVSIRENNVVNPAQAPSWNVPEFIPGHIKINKPGVTKLWLERTNGFWVEMSHPTMLPDAPARPPLAVCPRNAADVRAAERSAELDEMFDWQN